MIKNVNFNSKIDWAKTKLAAVAGAVGSFAYAGAAYAADADHTSVYVDAGTAFGNFASVTSTWLAGRAVLVFVALASLGGLVLVFGVALRKLGIRRGLKSI